MKKLLNVPYISQWDTNASFSKNDCIPVSSAMLVNYYKGIISPDQISTKIGVQGLITFEQIRKALESFQYKIIGLSFKTISDLKKSIDSGVPFIAVLHYGDLPNRQDTYTGGHAVVVTGYDDSNIYVNDPNFWGDRRAEGNNKAYPIALFDKAWQSKADGNNPGNFWYLDHAVPGSSLSMDLDVDIPSIIEDKYDLKSNDWYSKYWTGGEFIEDTIKTHKELKDVSDKYKNLQKDYKTSTALLEENAIIIQQKDNIIQDSQKASAEATANLAVAFSQVTSAIAEKNDAVVARDEMAVELDDALEELEVTDLLLEQANIKLEIAENNLKLNLKGYSKFKLLKAFFGIF